MEKRGVALIGATSGKSSSGYIAPRLTMGLLGLKGRIVTGYKGSSRSILAIEQGEAQMAALNWLAWASKVPHWFKGESPLLEPFAAWCVQRSRLTKCSNAGRYRPSITKSARSLLGSAGPIGRGLAFPPGVTRILSQSFVPHTIR